MQFLIGLWIGGSVGFFFACSFAAGRRGDGDQPPRRRPPARHSYAIEATVVGGLVAAIAWNLGPILALVHS